ncbi:MAG: hypothetical protein V4665_00965 [Patescibacteria group bacterium]
MSIIILKIALYIVIAVFIWLQVATIRLGRKFSQSKYTPDSTKTYYAHKKAGKRLFWLILIILFGLEAFVRLKGGASVIDRLLVIHIGLSFVYLVLLGLLNWPLSGKGNQKRKKRHKIVAYISLIFFLGMIATAIPIIYRL